MHKAVEMSWVVDAHDKLDDGAWRVFDQAMAYIKMNTTKCECTENREGPVRDGLRYLFTHMRF